MKITSPWFAFAIAAVCGVMVYVTLRDGESLTSLCVALIGALFACEGFAAWTRKED